MLDLPQPLRGQVALAPLGAALDILDDAARHEFRLLAFQLLACLLVQFWRGLGAGNGCRQKRRHSQKGFAIVAGMAVTRSPNNRCKILRLETCPADQSAVHVGDRHERLGIVRLYRASVKDAYGLPVAAKRSTRSLRMAACTSATSSGVGVNPVPIAHTGS